MTSQMAMISTVLPIAFGLFSLQFPAGLVLYFLVSNLWRLGQQELIMRRITGPIKAQGPIEVKGAEKSKGVIEVEEAPPAPKAAGGLRKLFQPAAPPAIEAESDADVTEPSGNGAAKQPTTPNAKKPAAKPAASKPAASTRGGQADDRVERHHPEAELPAGGCPPEEQQAPKAAVAARSFPHSRPRLTSRPAPSVHESRRDAFEMEWVETTGRTVAEALDAALDELGVDETEVEYEVMEQPRTRAPGALQRGERRIRARVKPISREKPGERQRRNRRGGGSGQGRSSSDRPSRSRSGTAAGARGRRRTRRPPVPAPPRKVRVAVARRAPSLRSRAPRVAGVAEAARARGARRPHERREPHPPQHPMRARQTATRRGTWWKRLSLK